MVAEVRHARSVSYQHLHKTVAGPNDNVYVTVSFDRSRGSSNDAYVEVAFSILEYVVC